MMDISLDSFRHSIEKMKEQGVILSRGLSAVEFEIVEKRYDICFPPDLRTFYQLALPISKGDGRFGRFDQEYYPNWRSINDEDQKFIRFYLDWPVDMIQGDVEHKDLWITDWGERPEDITERREKAGEFVRKAPRLIPIHGHTFIPQDPHETHNPIFSMHGFDTVFWAKNLDFYWKQFDSVWAYEHRHENNLTNVREIPFWTDLIWVERPKLISYRNKEGK